MRSRNTRANIIASYDISEKSAHCEVDYEGDDKKIAGMPKEEIKEELRGGQQHLFPAEV